jgi:hypothetical protein
MTDLNIEATLKNKYGEFDVVVNEMDLKELGNELAKVTLLEDTPFAEKGDSSWVEVENVDVR